MIIKSHLCGIAVAFDRFEGEAYEDNGTARYSPFFNSTSEGRPQGSLYSQQKRKIADATEYMRLNHAFKPRIFVLTSPGYTNMANEGYLIQKFTHNLRNGYGCKNYLWVREATQKGYPHFHFIADCDHFDAVDMSKYWSSLFRSNATNSVRLGTAPKCSRCNKKLRIINGEFECKTGCVDFKAVRDYYIKSKKMAWYLTKYIGKGINQSEKYKLKKPFLDFKDEGWFYRDLKLRTFAVSRTLTQNSKPTEYISKMVRVETGRQALTVHGLVPFMDDVRRFRKIDIETGEVLAELTEEEAASTWNWQYTGFANTYKGYPKEWKLKRPKRKKADSILTLDMG